MGWEDEEEEFMDDVQEREEVDDKELITLVRANPVLYNKAEKLYSNSEVKRLSWATIGNHLSKKKTGIFARFIYLCYLFIYLCKTFECTEN